MKNKARHDRSCWEPPKPSLRPLIQAETLKSGRKGIKKKQQCNKYPYPFCKGILESIPSSAPSTETQQSAYPILTSSVSDTTGGAQRTYREGHSALGMNALALLPSPLKRSR